MGLGNDDDVVVDDSDGVCGSGGGGGGGQSCGGSVSCSICLEDVADNGDRSWAKLQCGHQFHLDCIASAFNVKGAMQCPNCRKIEKGQWNSASAPSDVPTSYAFADMDLHYHNWEHHAPPFSTTSSRIGGADQPSIPPVSQRPALSGSDVPSSSARAGSSITSSMIPPYPGSNARARDRVQALQAYYQQQQPSNSPTMRTSTISGARRSSSHRGFAQVGPVASSSDQTGFYYFPSGSSGRNFQEAENPLPSQFHAWEQEHLPSFSSNQVDRDQGWVSFHQAAGGSDSALRSSGFCPRHGSERTSSQDWS